MSHMHSGCQTSSHTHKHICITKGSRPTSQFTSIMARPIHATRRLSAAFHTRKWIFSPRWQGPPARPARSARRLSHRARFGACCISLPTRPRRAWFKFLVIKRSAGDLLTTAGCYLHTSGTMGAGNKNAVKCRKLLSSCDGSFGMDGAGRLGKWNSSF